MPRMLESFDIVNQNKFIQHLQVYKVGSWFIVSVEKYTLKPLILNHIEVPKHIRSNIFTFFNQLTSFGILNMHLVGDHQYIQTNVVEKFLIIFKLQLIQYPLSKWEFSLLNWSYMATRFILNYTFTCNRLPQVRLSTFHYLDIFIIAVTKNGKDVFTLVAIQLNKQSQKFL